MTQGVSYMEDQSSQNLQVKPFQFSLFFSFKRKGTSGVSLSCSTGSSSCSSRTVTPSSVTIIAPPFCFLLRPPSSPMD